MIDEVDYEAMYGHAQKDDGEFVEEIRPAVDTSTTGEIDPRQMAIEMDRQRRAMDGMQQMLRRHAKEITRLSDALIRTSTAMRILDSKLDDKVSLRGRDF
jgi:hypothetical protein